MAPFVSRKVHVTVETTFSETTNEHELYVPKRSIKRDDKVIPYEKVLEVTLIDVAREHPEDEELQKALEARGIVMDEEDIDIDAFLQLKQREALAVVEECEDEILLQQLMDAELDRKPRPRTAVLDALSAKGASTEAEEDEEPAGGEV